MSGHREKRELNAKIGIAKLLIAGRLMHFKLSNGIDVLCMKGETLPLEIEAARISRTDFMREIRSVFTEVSLQCCGEGPILKVTCRFRTCCISNESAHIKQENYHDNVCCQWE